MSTKPARASNVVMFGTQTYPDPPPCSSCKFCRKSMLPPDVWHCTHPRFAKVNPITGRTEHSWCKLERDWFACGPDGKLFEPRMSLLSKLATALRGAP